MILDVSWMTCCVTEMMIVVYLWLKESLENDDTDNIGNIWQYLIGYYNNWQGLKIIDNNWQEITRIDKNWQELARIGKNWQELTRIDKNQC